MESVLLIPAPLIHQQEALPYVPYGLLSLQAVARRQERDVSILPFWEALAGHRLHDSDELVDAAADLVEPERFGAVGLSTTCGSFHHALGIAAELKRRDPAIEVWLGGPHVSLHPELVLERYPEVDAVFVGEGEATFGEALARFDRSARESIAGIPGVFTRDVAFTARNMILDLDELPFIGLADDFLPLLRHARPAVTPGVPLEVERGCPGRCTFCATRLHWGARPRHKSPRHVIEEMHRLHELTGQTFFSLIGDNLAAPHSALLSLCDALVRQAPVYQWVACLTLERLEPSDLDLLWSSGCRGFFVGVESGSQQTLDRLHKGINLEHLVQMISEAVDRGFSIDSTMMVGFPWETTADLRQTYELHARLLERGVHHSHVVPVCPMPGTVLAQEYEHLVRSGDDEWRVASDDLPRGPQASALMRRCPELFRHFGRFAADGLNPADLGAILQAATTLSDRYERRTGR